MAENQTLKTFVTEIADAIREVKGTTEKIVPNNFKNEIKDLKVNVEDDKTVTPSTETQVIKPDEGYDALSQITINPIPEEFIIPDGQLSITENGIYDVTSKKSVEVLVQSEAVEKYEGVYEVTPSTAETAQILETKNKTLLDNITVKPIPFFQVDNSEGTTVYIGTEVDINGL